MSNQLINNIPNNEKIIFKISYNASGALLKRFLITTIICIIFGAVIVIPIGIVVRYNFSRLLIPLLITGALYLIVSIPLYKKTKLKKKANLFLTDKKIYVEKPYFKYQLKDSIDYTFIRAISFKKRKKKFGSKVNVGTLSILPNYSYNNKPQFTLESFPFHNVSRIQNILESILYEYGEIEERWNKIREKLNIQFPFKINVSTPNSDLSFDTDKLILTQDNISKKIIFNRETVVYFFNTNLWSENVNFNHIKIKPSIDSLDEISFVPIDNFLDISEAIYCYILKWKAERDLLLSNEQLIKQKFEEIEKIPEDIKKDYLIKDIEIKRTEGLKLKPIEYSNPIYQNYQNRLEPDERIYFTRHETGIHKLIISISLPIFLISLSIILIAFIGNISISYIIPGLSIVFLIFSLCALVGGFGYKYKIGNIFLVFTDKKIIADYRTNCCIINYNNISLITRKPTFGNYYTIELILKEWLENNPHLIKNIRGEDAEPANTFYINKIPLDDNLIDKLKYLKEMEH